MDGLGVGVGWESDYQFNFNSNYPHHRTFFTASLLKCFNYQVRFSWSVWRQRRV